MRRVIFFCICLTLSFVVRAREELQAGFLVGFLVGDYHLLGKALNSDATYFGKLSISKSKDGLRIARLINGRKIIGRATVEKANAGEVNVLRVRFNDGDLQFEETCMVAADLDNYARVTCHLYQPGVGSDQPGMEAWFSETITE